jgi:hypothetical protein
MLHHLRGLLGHHAEAAAFEARLPHPHEPPAASRQRTPRTMGLDDHVSVAEPGLLDRHTVDEDFKVLAYF